MARAATAEPTAFEAECARQALGTVVETRFDPGDITLDMTRSASQLTSMKSLGGRWKTSGLTTMTQRFGIRTQTRVMHDIDGRGCALPRFEITLTVLPQRIFVGREFAQGSCSFDEIVAHEMRHVQANREHAYRVSAAFEAELRTAFAQAPVFGDPATLNDRVVDVLRTDWVPRLKAQLEQVDTLHSKIDSEAEFDRLSHICGGEIGATLAPSASR